MGEYKRPVVIRPKYFDDAGNEIIYGQRWPEGPPEDQYAVVRNPERFAPLYPITRAIIAHLHEQFEVELLKEHSRAGFGIPGATSTGGSVILEPLSPKQASIEFHFLPEYGIQLRAGHFYQALFPHCGCEACDVSWEGAAEDLERTVFSIVDGNFMEAVTAWPHRWLKYELTAADDQGGATRSGPDERQRFKQLRIPLRGTSWDWQPWQRRL